jgi:Domain of unknown function (DUF4419)
MKLLKFSRTARVIEHSEDGITFEVDEAPKTPRDLLTEGAHRHFAKHGEGRLVACSHKDSLEVVRENNVHPLAGAVHLAFSEHRPLRLTPDHIWLTIAQGFAHHVNNNSEALRPRLFNFQDKMVLQVTTSQLEGPEDWAGVINEWAEDIGDFIPGELSQTLLCDFTTTTPAARIASQIVMMDAFQRFFDYRVYCVCGIPSVTLAGTVEDWRRILSRVEHLGQYDLRWWTDRLLPICEAFAQTADGNPPLEFWRSIYKPKEIYGGELITGWLADLFPYIIDWHHTKTSSPTVKNPVLSVPRHELTADHGIEPRWLPRGLSRVPVALETGTAETRLELMAGFIGVKFDRRKDERLEPEIGWGVRETEKLPELLAEIKHEHPTQPAFAGPDSDDLRYLCRRIPHELFRLMEQFDGATLYAGTDHSWRIRRSNDYESCCLLGRPNSQMILFIDLADGRILSCLDHERSIKTPDGKLSWMEELWVVVGRPEKYFDEIFKTEAIGLKSSEAQVVAKGLEQFFERILKAGGRYFFDEPGFTPEDSF